MEVLPFIRTLWRRRRLVGLGAVVALVVALAAGGSTPTSSAVAWTRVTLDTPTSQLVKSAPGGASTLPWRASLVAHLLGTDAAQRQLARQLGVRPDQVVVVDRALADPKVPASMPDRAAEAAAVTVAPYVLSVYLRNPMLPLISVEAAAPDRAAAERLAAAAVAVLKSQGSPGGRYASPVETGGGVAQTLQAFVVEQVAPVRAKTVTASALPMKAVVAPIVLFALWCAFLVLAPLLPGRRSRAAHAAG